MEFIRFEEVPAKSGKLGLIILDRGQALNALALDMIKNLYQKLQEWAVREDIFAVLIRSASERAFSAGGDIRALYQARGDFSHQLEFFTNEYALNYLIGTYPKPYIALMNGIVMGGGAGISIHGSHRVGCESLVFAMPETGIGLFPDVGSSYFLQKAPGYLGRYLGLTGSKINLADAAYAGLVDYCISSNSYDDVVSALLEAEINEGGAKEKVSTILESFSIKPDKSFFEDKQDFLNGIFSGEHIETIFNYLDNDDGEWTRAVSSHLKQKSPMSLSVTLELFKRARGKDLTFCLQQDYCVVQSMLLGNDLYEGIRAVVVDKDMLPKWQPATLQEIRDDQIKDYFAMENKQILDID